MSLYRIVDDQWIELIKGPFKGITYQYGKVKLVEHDDHLQIQFEYFLKEGEVNHQEFKEYIGPILGDLISNGLVNNSIVYTGGVDVED